MDYTEEQCLLYICFRFYFKLELSLSNFMIRNEITSLNIPDFPSFEYVPGTYICMYCDKICIEYLSHIYNLWYPLVQVQLWYMYYEHSIIFGFLPFFVNKTLIKSPLIGVFSILQSGIGYTYLSYLSLLVIFTVYGCFTHLRIVHQTDRPAWNDHRSDCPL